MQQIFISYRRDDSAYVAGIISERLQAAFGEGSVFIDIDTIPLGVDFRAHIQDAISRCGILLAIIGENWFGTILESARRRIDDPADFVRLEVEAALARGIPVVPVLVGKATLPSVDVLPENLHPLAYRNAAEVRPGRNLDFHIETLVRGLRAHFATPPPPQSATAPEPPTPPPTLPVTPAVNSDQSVHLPRQRDPKRGRYEPPSGSVSTLRLTRAWNWTQRPGSVTVFIRDALAGQLHNGSTIDIPVSTGEVPLEITFGRHRLQQNVTVPIGETLSLTCRVDDCGEVTLAPWQSTEV